MDHYDQVSKIVFVDILLNKEIDLSYLSGFSYPFENSVQGVQNGRFLLRFYGSSAPSSVQTVDNETIRVYPGESGMVVNTLSSDPIRQIRVYDLQGRKLYEKELSNSSSYWIPESFGHRQVIVRVVTQQNAKNINIISIK
jgi:hypothetical protein